MAETILIVDDEDSVRETFREWLAGLADVKTLPVADAAAALRAARDEPVDLAILDWNLGAGQNGLQLLEDLQTFRPDLVAILVTGYAQQATPLDALRMGVRDYFDKSQDFGRATLEAAVERQLRLIRPLKRERQVRAQLARFQAAAEEALSVVRAGAAAPGSETFRQIIQQMLSFMKSATGAGAAHLVWRVYAEKPTPGELRRRYRDDGGVAEETTPPFGQTLAGAAAGEGDAPRALDLQEAQRQWNLKLTTDEARHGRAVLLPLRLSPSLLAVIELLGGPDGWTAAADSHLRSAAPVYGELLRLAAGQQETQQLLLDALEAALQTSRAVGDEAARAAGLKAALQSSLDLRSIRDLESPEALAVAEQLRGLAGRHGPRALRRVLAILGEVRKLLDEQLGTEASA